MLSGVPQGSRKVIFSRPSGHIYFVDRCVFFVFCVDNKRVLLYNNDMEEILDENITRVTSLIEPILVIGLSFFVGTIVIGLFLPIIALIQNIAA